MRQHLVRVCAIIVGAALFTSTLPAFAERGGSGPSDKDRPQKKESTRVRIKQRLDRVEGLSPDLVASKGNLDYEGKSNKKKSIVTRQLKVRVVLPAAASLGVADAAGAALLPLHFEVLRAGAVVSDCTLAFQEPQVSESEETPTKFQFRLHGHANAKGRVKLVKGECADGLPTLQSTDGVKVYAIVADARVELMTGGDESAFVAPTPTPAPTP